MIKKLKEKNEKLIEFYKNDALNLEKQLLIKNILNDKKCFFKMSIETAYSILKDLKVEEEKIKEVYMNLIDYENV